MKKLMDIDIIDIIPFSKGLIFARKESLQNDSVKVSFFSYDLNTERAAPVTKGVYLLNKFGSAYKPIVEQIGDYISCDVAALPGSQTSVVYPTGEMGLFDPEGVLYWTGDLMYHDFPVRGVAADNKHIWCVVPDNNSVIRYSLASEKVVLRIGGDRSTAFASPVSLNIFDGELYICNQGTCRIRTINLKDYSVKDYKVFEEPVHRYIRSCGKEIVVLNSGVYQL
ncbi:MAG: hypothetical protein GX051_02120 [Clostridiales bacterium]|nr:hypothetical protein [Clostridiales bacterium]